MKKVKYKHAKYVGYKDAIKNIDDIDDIEDFTEAMKNGSITVLAKHPETGILSKFKVISITDDGNVSGYFYNSLN